MQSVRICGRMGDGNANGLESIEPVYWTVLDGIKRGERVCQNVLGVPYSMKIQLIVYVRCSV